MLNRMSEIRTGEGRTAVVIRNMGASLVIRGTSLILGLMTLPAYLRFFEDQRVLGVWFTIVTMLSWILNFDFGMGNGLRNRLVDAIASRDSPRISGYISSAYISTSVVVAILAVGSWLSFARVDWNTVLNVPGGSIDNTTLQTVVTILTAGILLQFVLRLISSILYAIQRSAVPALLNVITTASLLVFVTLADSGSESTNLAMLAIAHAVAVNFPLVCATIIVFRTTLKSNAPSLRHFDFSFAADVLRLGGVFFFLQIANMLINSSDPFLISVLSDPKHVVDFQIYSRPFVAISSIFSLALTPIWSAVTQASAQADFLWIQRLHGRLTLMAAIVTCALFAFTPFLQPFVDFWLGNETMPVDLGYALLFAASSSVFAWNVALTSVVNGTGHLKIQTIMLSLGVFLKLGISYVLVHLTGEWIWVVVSGVIALVPYLVIQHFSIKRLIHRSVTNSSP